VDLDLKQDPDSQKSLNPDPDPLIAQSTYSNVICKGKEQRNHKKLFYPMYFTKSFTIITMKNGREKESCLYCVEAG
jgi:hypothetical protein